MMSPSNDIENAFEEEEAQNATLGGGRRGLELANASRSTLQMCNLLNLTDPVWKNLLFMLMTARVSVRLDNELKALSMFDYSDLIQLKYG